MQHPTSESSLASAAAGPILGLLLAAAVPAAPGSADEAPRITHMHMETLERTSPGWTATEDTGPGASGRVAVERIVWPLFYLHWRPLSGEGGVGEKLSMAEAEKVVAGLWEGMVFDAPLAGKKIVLGTHEGVVIEATSSHGEWKSRYIVWACPESGRLFIADANASLKVTVPPALMDIMEEIARSVRCHEGAKVEPFPLMKKQRQVPDTDISYGLPFTWFPIAGYRVQSTFGTGEFATATHPAATKTKGQDLALELDSLRRLWLSWEPAPDAPMTFDTLIERVHAFWKEHAVNLLPQGTRVSNDVWIMDGLVQAPTPSGLPPGRMHKFRAWMWRKDGVSYMAVGEVSGVRFGQRMMSEIQEIADLMVEEMFEAIDY